MSPVEQDTIDCEHLTFWDRKGVIEFNYVTAQYSSENSIDYTQYWFFGSDELSRQSHSNNVLWWALSTYIKQIWDIWIHKNRNFNFFICFGHKNMKKQSTMKSKIIYKNCRNVPLLPWWPICPIWHYRLWSFKTRDTKLEIFLHKNPHTRRKLLNFENWTNGEPQ